MSHLDLTPHRPPATIADQPAEPLPPQLVAIFGPALTMPEEDVDAYNDLHNRLRASVAPGDVIEELWVNDLLDYAWESLRLRRLKLSLLRSSQRYGLAAALAGLVPPGDIPGLVDGWFEPRVGAVKQIEQLLSPGGPAHVVIAAHTLACRLDVFERVDRLTALADARRNAVLREIHHHRAALAQRLRDLVTVEDAEFEEVPSAPSLAPA